MLANFVINSDGYTQEDPGALDASNVPAFQVLVGGADTEPVSAGKIHVVAVPQFGSLLSMSYVYTANSPGSVRLIVSVDLICKEF